MRPNARAFAIFTDETGVVNSVAYSARRIPHCNMIDTERNT
jgi:hypothetical protein